MESLISNAELTTDQLPSLDDAEGIFRFAMSFNGYEEFGSLSASAEAARLRSRDSLTSIRNELFFAARAARHMGESFYIQTYAELLPQLKDFLQTTTGDKG